MMIGAKLPWSKTAVHGILEIEGESGDCTPFGWDKVCISPHAQNYGKRTNTQLESEPTECRTLERYFHSGVRA